MGGNKPTAIATDEGIPLLRAAGLGYRFADGAWAFRGIDFSINAGELSVLAGRNGAGKTFFAKNLSGLIEPTEGSVFVSGVDLGRVPGIKSKLVGYVFQDARLQVVGETVLDDVLFGPTNLGLGPGEARAAAEDALLACGLETKKQNFIPSLSGGEIRRLAIAGVLAMSPRAVILDEPFVNLDWAGVKAVLQIARGMIAKGIGLLIVTHEIEKVIGLAHVFSVMDSGKVVLSGEPAAVLESGIESYGIRNPFRSTSGIEELQWSD